MTPPQHHWFADRSHQTAGRWAPNWPFGSLYAPGRRWQQLMSQQQLLDQPWPAFRSNCRAISVLKLWCIIQHVEGKFFFELTTSKTRSSVLGPTKCGRTMVTMENGSDRMRYPPAIAFPITKNLQSWIDLSLIEIQQAWSTSFNVIH